MNTEDDNISITLLNRATLQNRNKVVSITLFIIQTRIGGLLQYDPTDQNECNMAENKLNTILQYTATGSDARIEQCPELWYVSHLYEKSRALFTYLMQNMNNTKLIQKMPRKLDFITSRETQRDLKKVLNTVFTINKLKHLLKYIKYVPIHDGYYQKLQDLFAHYNNKDTLRGVNFYFNLGFIGICITDGENDAYAYAKLDDYLSNTYVAVHSAFKNITNDQVRDLYIAICKVD